MKQAKLLTPAEQKRVYAIIDAHRYSVRNRTIFAFSFYAGLRACEIASLRVVDVFDAEGAVRDTVYFEATQTKGDEAGTVLVSKRLAKALVQYAVVHAQHVTCPTSPLFFSAKRGGFTAQTMVNLFRRFYSLASIKGASSHSGRRQFLTELADKGVNVRVIQALARHKNISATSTSTRASCATRLIWFECVLEPLHQLERAKIPFLWYTVFAGLSAASNDLRYPR